MTLAAALAQHIATLNPDKDAARLSFHNYLNYLCSANDVVNSDLINRFYRKALSFSHWQTNKAALFAETEALLTHYQESVREALPLEYLIRASDLQVIAAENIRDLETVTRIFLEKNLEPHERLRILRDGDNRVIAITLGLERTLKVSTYPKALMLTDGALRPLDVDQALFYTPDLQMKTSARQQTEVGPFTSACFTMGAQGLRGSIVRGYTFQRCGVIDGGGLNRYPLLFYPVKRLEQFFVDRKTDPMYIDLITALQTASENLSPQSAPEDWRLARAAFERGRLALDHIFPDDNYARLLINNLEKQLAFETTPVDVPKEEPWPEIRNLPV